MRTGAPASCGHHQRTFRCGLQFARAPHRPIATPHHRQQQLQQHLNLPLSSEQPSWSERCAGGPVASSSSASAPILYPTSCSPCDADEFHSNRSGTSSSSVAHPSTSKSRQQQREEEALARTLTRCKNLFLCVAAFAAWVYFSHGNGGGVGPLASIAAAAPASSLSGAL